MRPLEAQLIARIREAGPITVADYMAECLLHPEHGYYATRDPFGQAGDFITAPEISQMFGELLGLCLAQCWLDQGAPARFALAELGPGRGTLMADVLRATRGVPGFLAAAEVVLIEASSHLRAVQAQTLAAHAPRWVQGVDDLPDQPLFLLANEFFDALPIRQYQRGDTGWCERLIGLAAGSLAFGLSAPLPLPDPRFDADPPGTVVEICPALPAIVQGIGARITDHGGVALIVDYGGWRSRGDTLQALHARAPAPVLDAPGEADLTAHVDFEAITLASPAAVSGMTDQGTLLIRLGIDGRAERLAASLSGPALEAHRAAHHRLTAPKEMGRLFKAIALTPPGHAAPGFDPA